MQVIKDHRLICVDVDETLLLFDWKDYTSDESKLVDVNGYKVLPNERNIDLIKRFKVRGFTIIVWSAGGWEWGQTVVNLLQLQSYVDIIMSKPSWYIDDLPANVWMGKNIWLHPNDKDKDIRSLGNTKDK